MTRKIVLLTLGCLIAGDVRANDAPIQLDELEQQLQRAKRDKSARERERQQQEEAALRAEQEREQAEARLATLVVRADRDCDLRINGASHGALVARQTVTTRVVAGEHLIECVTVDGATADATIAVGASQQKVVQLAFPVEQVAPAAVKNPTSDVADVLSVTPITRRLGNSTYFVYDVSYRYKDRTYQARTGYDPGPTIRVNLSYPGDGQVVVEPDLRGK